MKLRHPLRAAALAPAPAPALALALALALGVPAASTAAEPGFDGRSFDGRSYALAGRSGRVVMVMLWRTDCAVCLSKMPELRANAAGWQQRAFDLVTINLDASRADAEAYERARQASGATRYPVWSLWGGDSRLPPEWRQAPRLPVLMVFDTQGRLVRRHEGRLPAEAWDEVAELLP